MPGRISVHTPDTSRPSRSAASSGSRAVGPCIDAPARSSAKNTQLLGLLFPKSRQGRLKLAPRFNGGGWRTAKHQVPSGTKEFAPRPRAPQIDRNKRLGLPVACPHDPPSSFALPGWNKFQTRLPTVGNGGLASVVPDGTTGKASRGRSILAAPCPSSVRNARAGIMMPIVFAPVRNEHAAYFFDLLDQHGCQGSPTRMR